MTADFKPVSSSKISISELMLPSHTNFSGKIHGGYILQLLDQIAFKRCCDLIDEILQDYRVVINRSYQGYSNHCKRVAACCLILSADRSYETLHKIANSGFS